MDYKVFHFSVCRIHYSKVLSAVLLQSSRTYFRIQVFQLKRLWFFPYTQLPQVLLQLAEKLRFTLIRYSPIPTLFLRTTQHPTSTLRSSLMVPQSESNSRCSGTLQRKRQHNTNTSKYKYHLILRKFNLIAHTSFIFFNGG